MLQPGTILVAWMIIAAGCVQACAGPVQPASATAGYPPLTVPLPAVPPGSSHIVATGPGAFRPGQTVTIPRLPASGRPVTILSCVTAVRPPSFPVAGGDSVPFPWAGIRYGALAVTTWPPGATVLIDGMMAGRTPASFSRVSAGQHHIGLLLAGYLPDSLVVSVGAGTTGTVDVVLVPEETAPAGEVDAGGDLPAVEAAVLKYTNLERTGRGLPPLSWDGQLAAVALRNSREMDRRHYFAHVNPDGEDLFARLDRAGYRWKEAGENIIFSARLPADADPDLVGKSLVRLWMASPSHRSNILAPYYSLSGSGTVYEPDTTRTPHGFISTQLFAGI